MPSKMKIALSNTLLVHMLDLFERCHLRCLPCIRRPFTCSYKDNKIDKLINWRCGRCRKADCAFVRFMHLLREVGRTGPRQKRTSYGYCSPFVRLSFGYASAFGGGKANKSRWITVQKLVLPLTRSWIYLYFRIKAKEGASLSLKCLEAW